MNKGVKANLINEKNAQIKLKTDRFLKVFIFIFIFGYTLFLSSNIWMPASYTNIDYSKPGTTLEEEGMKVQLLKWSYSKEDDIIEAVLKRDNFSISDKSYKWKAVEKNKGYLDTQIIINNDELVVVHIKNLPFRWREISLRMESKNEDSNSNIKFYVTKKDVEKVKHIADLGLEDYKRLSVSYLIDIYENDNKKASKKIDNLKEDVAVAEGRIREIKENQKYETDIEKEESNQAISDIENELTTFRNQIDELNAQIEENNQKINLQKLKLE